MIFNKNLKGAEELKALLGFIYKSNSFANMITYIGFAERDIQKVIGDAVFNTAQDHYDSSDYLSVSEEGGDPVFPVLDDLVKSIQLSVALHAYRRYAPNNDLTHSDSGRSITVTETEKPAFEWMINKSDASILDLAHEATDLLLEFLDKHIDDTVTSGDPGVTTYLLPWGTSAEFMATRQLFISKDQFNEEFFIDGSRRVFLALVPYLKKIQLNEILACIGKELYDELSEQIKDDDVTEENEILLTMVRPALAFLALSRAVISLSLEILPNGIFSNFVTGVINSKTAADHSHRVEISHALESLGLKELSRLQEKMYRKAVEDSGETYTQTDTTDRIDPDNLYVRI